MKKLIILFLVLVPFLYSCDKESEGVSSTVYYVKILLNQGPVMVIKQGSTYADPGFVATENGVDVNAKVKVEGSVDPNTVGGYIVTYSAENKDGYAAEVERLVLVLPNVALSTEDISGIYSGQRAGKPLVKEASAINQIQDGLFEAEDFFGGYYNITMKYGGGTRLKTYFILKSDNTIESIYNNSPDFGQWDILNGLYNPATGQLTYKVNQEGFGFGVTLTKN